MTYKRAHRVPWRVVEGKAVLISVRNSEVMVLNEIGTEIWTFLDRKRSRDDIVEHLFSKFDAERTAIENDVDSFLDNMREKEIVDVG